MRRIRFTAKKGTMTRKKDKRHAINNSMMNMILEAIISKNEG